MAFIYTGCKEAISYHVHTDAFSNQCAVTACACRQCCHTWDFIPRCWEFLSVMGFSLGFLWQKYLGKDLVVDKCSG